jgi:uncharacterized C2H2 Zn-finger protein
MPSKISRCNSCRKFFNSKRALKEHIDKNHRITNSKVVPSGITKRAVSLSSSKKPTIYDQKKSSSRQVDTG